VDASTLTALSPLDGRYAAKAASLREYLSEYALIRYRVMAEVRWLQHLSDDPAIAELPALEPPTKDLLNKLVDDFQLDDARRVKALEEETNHDVKAVEYLLREKLAVAKVTATTLPAFLHFACTSEDINNVAYALMLREARSNVLLPACKALAGRLRAMAHRYADVAMLSRTHGQTASPTTLGKELANYTARFEHQLQQFAEVKIYAKFNGAVGNYNAHRISYPEIDWPLSNAEFLRSLDLEATHYTTQIEPHDWVAEYCQSLHRLNTVLVDLCRDLWAYVSLGYFRSRPVANEVGSSTMPHKVNPIDFENAEGNLGIANVLLEHFAAKLPVSRWQRDLTDSTVLRNLGTAFGHSLVAFGSTEKGLGKLEPNASLIASDLTESWEVLAEAVQTVMRKHGIVDAYEQLKTLTRGQAITQALLAEFISSQPIPEPDRSRLLQLRPEDYVGYAVEFGRRI
jgi:adenylosuccinate lyase